MKFLSLGALLVGIAGILGAGASMAQAETVMWSSNTGQLCDVAGCDKYRLTAISQQIHYSVRVTNAKTGEVLKSNTTVPFGTTVLYQFLPHISADITWFRTGSGHDSPYGDWIAGAGSAGEMCITKNYVGKIGKNSDRKAWANLSVNPPVKTVVGAPVGCVTAPDGVSQVCTLSQAGTVSVKFQFAQTNGKYYSEYQTSGSGIDGKCGPGQPMLAGSTVYTLPVPLQTIPFVLTVAEKTTTDVAPTAPSLNAIGSGQCTVAAPYTIQMTGTDADNDNIRYGVDWDNNGSIDQYVPASGYVSSGTTMSASRTFSTTGSKTIKVYTQDQRGLLSAPATLTFNCTAQQNVVTEGGDNLSGFTGDTNLGDHNNDGDTGTNSAQGDIRTSPSLVKVNTTSRVIWSAQNVTSCTVRGANGDQWTGTSGTRVTSPITERTVYTLTCQTGSGTLTDIAAVNILPTFREI